MKTYYFSFFLLVLFACNKEQEPKKDPIIEETLTGIEGNYTLTDSVSYMGGEYNREITT